MLSANSRRSAVSQIQAETDWPDAVAAAAIRSDRLSGSETVLRRVTRLSYAEPRHCLVAFWLSSDSAVVASER
jgi:hypothetical protein